MSTTAPHLPPAPPTRDVDLSYMTLNAGAKSYGYIRIWTFAGQLGPTQFVNEFVKLLGKASASGLIIDIRDTPGRKIEAAERILQTLTGERITPEPFQFRNTDLNLRICMKGGDDEDDFRRWIPSIRAGLQNGKDYSDGFPKTDPALCNSVGRRYRGPVVLITSATTYSSADIFAAGFQDHKIGPVLGIHPTTGGGGANSTVHSDLEGLGLTNSPYAPLPQLAELRLALRRSLRVRGNEGVVLEDAGVKADVRHDVTRDDVLHGYPDMIQKAISLL